MNDFKNIGSKFDDLLEAEGLLEVATAIAVQRVTEWRMGQAEAISDEMGGDIGSREAR